MDNKNRFIRLVGISGFTTAEIENRINETVRSIQANGGKVVSMFPQNVSGADVYQIIYESMSEITENTKQKGEEERE
ncbi:MAG: hypothetical protein K2K02_01620 [Ruminococcus sp.]|nr:hypothetical protein [Ruminococcus sp.]